CDRARASRVAGPPRDAAAGGRPRAAARRRTQSGRRRGACVLPADRQRPGAAARVRGHARQGRRGDVRGAPACGQPTRGHARVERPRGRSGRARGTGACRRARPPDLDRAGGRRCARRRRARLATDRRRGFDFSARRRHEADRPLVIRFERHLRRARMLNVFRTFSLLTFLWLAGPSLAQQVTLPAAPPLSQPAAPGAPAAPAPVTETTSSDRREGSNNQKDWHFVGHVEMEFGADTKVYADDLWAYTGEDR